ncbi:MAG: cation-transporting P-type ATPase [Clostridia bacterium]
MANTKDEVNVEKLYGQECILPKEEFIKKYNVNEKGLKSSQAAERIDKYGKNELKQTKPKKWYNYFLESLFSPFNSILLGIVAILFYTDVYLPETPSYANIIVILVLVVASTLLEFFEEYRSNQAAEKLKALVSTTTSVIRDGKEIQVPIKDITLGDIVVLSAGSMIPADLRIIESKDLYVGQSSLTGESDAVRKLVNSELKLEDIR